MGTNVAPDFERLLDTSLLDLRVPARVETLFDTRGFVTVRDVVRLSPRSLLGPGLGKKSVADLTTALERHLGMTWADARVRVDSCLGRRAEHHRAAVWHSPGVHACAGEKQVGIFRCDVSDTETLEPSGTRLANAAPPPGAPLQVPLSAQEPKPEGEQAENLVPRKKKLTAHGRGAKAAFIRDCLAKLPNVRPKDLVATAAQAGLSISETQVYGIIAADATKKKTVSRARPVASKPKPGRKATGTGSSPNGAARQTIGEKEFIRAIVMNGMDWAHKQMANTTATSRGAHQ